MGHFVQKGPSGICGHKILGSTSPSELSHDAFVVHPLVLLQVHFHMGWLGLGYDYKEVLNSREVIILMVY